MPGEFLTESQQERYGRFAGEPSPAELARSVHFDDTDRGLIRKRRSAPNRLGFVLQLGPVRYLGTVLPNPIGVPPGVIAYVGRQLAIPDASALSAYMEREATRVEHPAEIRAIYAYQDFHDPPWRFRFTRWLYTRTWLRNERPRHLCALATDWLLQRKGLLPGIATLTRLLAHSRDRAALRAWQRLARLPNEDQRRQLEALLTVPEDKRRSRFAQVRQGPRHISGPAMIAALERYEAFRNLGIRALDFSCIPPVWLPSLARYATTGWAPNMARMPDDRRIATLVACAYAYTAATLEDALDLCDMLSADIAARATTLGQTKRLRSLHDLDQAALALAEGCSILLEEAHPDDEVRKAVFPRMSLEQIAQAITTPYDLARPPEEDYQEAMLTRYHTVRRFLPRVLATIAFKAARAGDPGLKAVDYLKGLQGRRTPRLDDAPLESVDAGWKRLVLDKAGEISQPA